MGLSSHNTALDQYSKRILYIDQDFFFPIVQEMYDQDGALWKAMLVCFFYTQKPYAGYPAKPLAGGKYNNEDEWPFAPNWLLVDLQHGTATTGDGPPGTKAPAEWAHEWYFNENVSINTPAVYSTNYLIQGVR
jgi:hypothetical protein